MSNTGADVKIPLVDLKGKATGDVKGPGAFFAIEPNENAVHLVCKGQRYRFYKKTATTKDRSEVKATGKKAYKQKGTGNARHGAKTAPIFVGGGIAFGPQNMNRKHKINKKLSQIALASVLSDRASSGQIRVLKADITTPQTKAVSGLLKALDYSSARIGVVVTNDSDMNLNKSARNLRNVDLLTEEKWTTYDFIKTDGLIFSENAFNKLVSRLEGKVEA